jgi:hypothetical protein
MNGSQKFLRRQGGISLNFLFQPNLAENKERRAIQEENTIDFPKVTFTLDGI